LTPKNANKEGEKMTDPHRCENPWKCWRCNDKPQEIEKTDHLSDEAILELAGCIDFLSGTISDLIGQNERFYPRIVELNKNLRTLVNREL
jgi:hypothetical protein